MKRLLALIFFFSCLNFTGFSQNFISDLEPGDLAFVSYAGDGTDEIAFVCLVDVAAGTVLYLSDQAWDDGSGGVFENNGSGNEECFIRFNVPTGGFVVGSVIVVQDNENVIEYATDGTTTTHTDIVTSSFSANGDFNAGNDFGDLTSQDQMFIFQPGGATQTDFNKFDFIAGAHWNIRSGTTDDSNWDDRTNGITESELPDDGSSHVDTGKDLTTGTTAVRFTSEVSDGNYSQFTEFDPSTTDLGLKTDWQTQLNNRANWTQSGGASIPTITALTVLHKPTTGNSTANAIQSQEYTLDIGDFVFADRDATQPDALFTVDQDVLSKITIVDPNITSNPNGFLFLDLDFDGVYTPANPDDPIVTAGQEIFRIFITVGFLKYFTDQTADYQFSYTVSDATFESDDTGIMTIEAAASTTMQTLNRDLATTTSGVGGQVTWTADFSSVITGLTAANFSLTGTLAGSSTISNVAEDPVAASGVDNGSTGDVWIITADLGAGNGTLGLDFDDAAGLTPTVTNTLINGVDIANEYTIDQTAPTLNSTLTFVQQNTDLTNVEVLLSFSEPLASVGVEDDYEIRASVTNPPGPSDDIDPGVGPTDLINTLSISSNEVTLGLDLSGVASADFVSVVIVSGLTDVAGNPVDPANNSAVLQFDSDQPILSNINYIDDTEITLDIVDVGTSGLSSATLTTPGNYQVDVYDGDPGGGGSIVDPDLTISSIDQNGNTLTLNFDGADDLSTALDDYVIRVTPDLVADNFGNGVSPANLDINVDRTSPIVLSGLEFISNTSVIVNFDQTADAVLTSIDLGQAQNVNNYSVLSNGVPRIPTMAVASGLGTTSPSVTLTFGGTDLSNAQTGNNITVTVTNVSDEFGNAVTGPNNVAAVTADRNPPTAASVSIFDNSTIDVLLAEGVGESGFSGGVGETSVQINTNYGTIINPAGPANNLGNPISATLQGDGFTVRLVYSGTPFNVGTSVVDGDVIEVTVNNITDNFSNTILNNAIDNVTSLTVDENPPVFAAVDPLTYVDDNTLLVTFDEAISGLDPSEITATDFDLVIPGVNGGASFNPDGITVDEANGQVTLDITGNNISAIGHGVNITLNASGILDNFGNSSGAIGPEILTIDRVSPGLPVQGLNQVDAVTLQLKIFDIGSGIDETTANDPSNYTVTTDGPTPLGNPSVAVYDGANNIVTLTIDLSPVPGGETIEVDVTGVLDLFGNDISTASTFTTYGSVNYSNRMSGTFAALDMVADGGSATADVVLVDADSIVILENIASGPFMTGTGNFTNSTATADLDAYSTWNNNTTATTTLTDNIPPRIADISYTIVSPNQIADVLVTFTEDVEMISAEVQADYEAIVDTNQDGIFDDLMGDHLENINGATHNPGAMGNDIVQISFGSGGALTTAEASSGDTLRMRIRNIQDDPGGNANASTFDLANVFFDILLDFDPPQPVGLTILSATSIDVTFDEPLTGLETTSAGTQGNYSASLDGGSAATFSGASVNGNVVTLTGLSAGDFTAAGTIDITVTSVTDNVGNSVDNLGGGLNTVTLSVDNTEPVVNNTLQVISNTELRIVIEEDGDSPTTDFGSGLNIISDDMDPDYANSALNPANYTVTSALAGRTVQSVSIFSQNPSGGSGFTEVTTLSLFFASGVGTDLSNATDGDDITVVASTNILDNQGNAIASPNDDAAKTLDTAPPEVVALLDYTEGATTAVISFVETGSGLSVVDVQNTSNYTVTVNAVNIGLLGINLTMVSLSGSDATMTFDSPLASAGGIIAVVAGAGIIDNDGNSVSIAANNTASIFVDETPPTANNPLFITDTELQLNIDEAGSGLIFGSTTDGNSASNPANYTVTVQPASTVVAVDNVDVIDNMDGTYAVTLNFDVSDDLSIANNLDDIDITIGNIEDVNGNIIDDGAGGTPVTITFVDLDRIQPQLLSVEFITTTRILLTFDEPMTEALAENTGNYQFTGITPGLFTATLDFNTDGSTDEVTLEVDDFSGISDGTAVIVTVNNLTDLFDNVIDPAASQGSFTFDKSPPTIDEAVVNTGANNQMVVTFNEGVSRSGTPDGDVNDLVLGFTMRINGTPVTTFTAAPQVLAEQITFSFTPVAVSGDVITLEYDPVGGEIIDDFNNPLGVINPGLAVTNNLFGDASNLANACEVESLNLTWTKPPGVQGVTWDGVFLIGKQGTGFPVDISPVTLQNLDLGTAVFDADFSAAAANGLANDGLGNVYLANLATDSDGDITITGLTPDTDYNFAVYTYNSISINSHNVTAGISLDGVQATFIETFQAFAGNGELTLNWTSATPNDCIDNVVILGRQGAPIESNVDEAQLEAATRASTSYTFDNDFTMAPDLNSLDGVGTAGQNFVVHVGPVSAGTTTITGLTNNLTYHFKIFMFDDSEGPDVSASLAASETPLGAPFNPTGFQVDCATENEIGLSWTQPAGTFGTNWNGVVVYGTEIFDVTDIAITSDNIVQYTLGGAPDLSTFTSGDDFVMNGAVNAVHNGTFTVTSVGANSITISNPDGSVLLINAGALNESPATATAQASLDQVFNLEDGPVISDAANGVFGNGTTSEVENGVRVVAVTRSSDPLDHQASISNVQNDKSYAFRAYAFRDPGSDDDDLFSTGTSDVTAINPEIITGFTASAGDGVVDLSWTNPTGTACFTNVVIIAAPTSTADGGVDNDLTQANLNLETITVYPGASTDFIAAVPFSTLSLTIDPLNKLVYNGPNNVNNIQITDLTNAQEYEFIIFLSGDQSTNQSTYSQGITLTAIPSGPASTLTVPGASQATSGVVSSIIGDPGTVVFDFTVTDDNMVTGDDLDMEISSITLTEVFNLDVNTIVYNVDGMGNTRYTFNGLPDLTAFAPGQQLEVSSAMLGANNGSFQIAAVGGSFMDVNNPARTDNTLDEGGGSPAIAIANPLDNWTDAILGVTLRSGSTFYAGTPTINTSDIVFAGINTSTPTSLGFVVDNAAKTYTVELWIDPALSNPTTIDNKQLGVGLSTADMTVVGSQFGDGNVTNTQILGAESMPGGIPKIEVIASELVFTDQPPVSINTGVAFTAGDGVDVTARDANGFFDLDYGSMPSNFNITNANSIPMTGISSLTFIDGVLDLTGLTYNTFGGDGTLTVTDVSGIGATAAVSNAVTVNDVNPPAFNATPVLSATTDQGFTLTVNLDELNAQIFYMVSEVNLVPGLTISDIVNNNGGVQASSFIYNVGSNLNQSIIIDGLDPSTQYFVYLFADDGTNQTAIQTARDPDELPVPTDFDVTLPNQGAPALTANITGEFATSIEMTFQLDEIGFIDYIVYDDNPARTSVDFDDVINGIDPVGGTVIEFGVINITDPDTDFVQVVSFLDPGTTYNIWVAAEDDDGFPPDPPIRLQIAANDPRTTTVNPGATGLEITQAPDIPGLCVGDFFPLDDIILTERSDDDIESTSSAVKTFILTLPNGFEFNTGVSATAVVPTPSSVTNINNADGSGNIPITVETNRIILDIATGGTNRTDVITISGLEVTATASAPINQVVSLERLPTDALGGDLVINQADGGNGRSFATFNAFFSPGAPMNLSLDFCQNEDITLAGALAELGPTNFATYEWYTDAGLDPSNTQFSPTSINYTPIGGSFNIGETIRGDFTGAEGVIGTNSANVLQLIEVNGTFSLLDNLQGLTSGATASIVSISNNRTVTDYQNDLGVTTANETPGSPFEFFVIDRDPTSLCASPAATVTVDIDIQPVAVITDNVSNARSITVGVENFFCLGESLIMNANDLTPGAGLEGVAQFRWEKVIGFNDLGDGDPSNDIYTTNPVIRSFDGSVNQDLSLAASTAAFLQLSPEIYDNDGMSTPNENRYVQNQYILILEDVTGCESHPSTSPNSLVDITTRAVEFIDFPTPTLLDYNTIDASDIGIQAVPNDLNQDPFGIHTGNDNNFGTWTYTVDFTGSLGIDNATINSNGTVNWSPLGLDGAQTITYSIDNDITLCSTSGDLVLNVNSIDIDPVTGISLDYCDDQNIDFGVVPSVADLQDRIDQIGGNPPITLSGSGLTDTGNDITVSVTNNGSGLNDVVVINFDSDGDTFIDAARGINSLGAVVAGDITITTGEDGVDNLGQPISVSQGGLQLNLFVDLFLALDDDNNPGNGVDRVEEILHVTIDNLTDAGGTVIFPEGITFIILFEDIPNRSNSFNVYTFDPSLGMDVAARNSQLQSDIDIDRTFNGTGAGSLTTRVTPLPIVSINDMDSEFCSTDGFITFGLSSGALNFTNGGIRQSVTSYEALYLDGLNSIEIDDIVNQTGEFAISYILKSGSVGTTITGTSESGVTANIIDSSIPGILRLNSLSGALIDGETITFNTGGIAQILEWGGVIRYNFNNITNVDLSISPGDILRTNLTAFSANTGAFNVIGVGTDFIDVYNTGRFDNSADEVPISHGINAITFVTTNIIRLNLSAGFPSLAGLQQGDIVRVTGATNPSNNGDFVVSAVNTITGEVAILNINRADNADDEGAGATLTQITRAKAWAGNYVSLANVNSANIDFPSLVSAWETSTSLSYTESITFRVEVTSDPANDPFLQNCSNLAASDFTIHPVPLAIGIDNAPNFTDDNGTAGNPTDDFLVFEFCDGDIDPTFTVNITSPSPLVKYNWYAGVGGPGRVNSNPVSPGFTNDDGSLITSNQNSSVISTLELFGQIPVPGVYEFEVSQIENRRPLANTPINAATFLGCEGEYLQIRVIIHENPAAPVLPQVINPTRFDNNENITNNNVDEYFIFEYCEDEFTSLATNADRVNAFGTFRVELLSLPLSNISTDFASIPNGATITGVTSQATATFDKPGSEDLTNNILASITGVTPGPGGLSFQDGEFVTFSGGATARVELDVRWYRYTGPDTEAARNTFLTNLGLATPIHNGPDATATNLQLDDSGEDFGTNIFEDPLDPQYEFYVVKNNFNDADGTDVGTFAGCTGGITRVDVVIHPEPIALSAIVIPDDFFITEFFICSGDDLDAIQTPRTNDVRYRWYNDDGTGSSPNFLSEITTADALGREATQADLITDGGFMNTVGAETTLYYWVTQTTNDDTVTDLIGSGFTGCESNTTRVAVTVYPPEDDPTFAAFDDLPSNPLRNAISTINDPGFTQDGVANTDIERRVHYCVGDIDASYAFDVDNILGAGFDASNGLRFRWRRSDANGADQGEVVLQDIASTDGSVVTAEELGIVGLQVTGAGDDFVTRYFLVTQETDFIASDNFKATVPGGVVFDDSFRGCESSGTLVEVVIFNIPDAPTATNFDAPTSGTPAGDPLPTRIDEVESTYFVCEFGTLPTITINGEPFDNRGNPITNTYIWYDDLADVGDPLLELYRETGVANGTGNATLLVPDESGAPANLAGALPAGTYNFFVTQTADEIGSSAPGFTGCESEPIEIIVSVGTDPIAPLVATRGDQADIQPEALPQVCIPNADFVAWDAASPVSRPDAGPDAATMNALVPTITIQNTGLNSRIRYYDQATVNTAGFDPLRPDLFAPLKEGTFGDPNFTPLLSQLTFGFDRVSATTSFFVYQIEGAIGGTVAQAGVDGTFLGCTSSEVQVDILMVVSSEAPTTTGIRDEVTGIDTFTFCRGDGVDEFTFEIVSPDPLGTYQWTNGVGVDIQSSDNTGQPFITFSELTDAGVLNINNPVQVPIFVTITKDGCTSLRRQVNIKVGAIPNTTFSYDGLSQDLPFTFVAGPNDSGNESFGEEEDVITFATFDFGDGSDPVTRSNSTGLELEDFTFEHSFAQAGVFFVSLTVGSNSDCSLEHTRRVPVLPVIPVTPSQPYANNFDSPTTVQAVDLGNSVTADLFVDGWVPDIRTLDDKGGVLNSNSNFKGDRLDTALLNFNTWQFGDVAGSTITEGSGGSVNAWVTNLSGNTALGERSWVFSPVFDLSALTRPMVKFDHIFDIQSRQDGVALQYSLDNGVTWVVLGDFNELSGENTGIGWYNGANIQGNPGNQSSRQVGWGVEPGASQTNAVWGEARHKLDIIAPQDRGRIIFRIAYGANSTSEQEGVGIDNFEVRERERIVLIEQFSGAVNGNVTLHNQAIGNVLDDPTVNNGDGVVITYQTDLLGPDAINASNPSDPNTRVVFYGVEDAPSSVLNGLTSISGGLVDGALPWRNSDFDKNSLVDPTVDIDLTLDPTAAGDVIAVNVNLNFVDQSLVSEETRLYIAVVEQLVDIDGTPLRNVLRQILPDAAGSAVTNSDGTLITSFNQTWRIGRVGNPDNLAVVAFIQDNATKEIFQTVSLAVGDKDDNIVTSIDDELDILTEEDINLYPNPADDEVFVTFGQFLDKEMQWIIYNQVGAQVKTGQIRSGEDGFVIDTSVLPSGLYLLRMGNEDQWLDHRKLIISH